ncbi:hypothetical protein ACFYN9_04655 [Streptomyces collinus]|uniref:hypothetical protein n=1 Tax=Streptomyces collinus TaxID=42684 RepID=UPI0036A0FDE2
MESFICALSAWDKKVLRVLAPERDYEGGESLEFSRPDGRDAPQPFGVEVQDPENPGQFLRCQNLEGAKPTIGGEPAHFDCWGGGGGLPIGGAMKVTAGAVRKYEDKPWEVPVLIDDESAEIRYAKVRKVFY